MRLISVLCTVLFSHQLNAQWTHIASPTINNLRSIHFANDSIGYIAGDNSTLLKTTDSGLTWTALSTGISGHYSSVHCSNKDTVYVSVNPMTDYSAPAKLLKTTDGGITWSVSSPFLNVNSKLKGIYSIAPNFIFCVGSTWQKDFSNYHNNYEEVGIGSRSGNGGSSWQIEAYFSNNYTIPWGNPTHSVHFSDTLTGYACSKFGISKTLDGGRTWTNLNSFNGNSIFFANLNTGYVAGDNGVIRKTINGGTSWTSQSSSVNTKLNSIHFTSPDTGCAVGIWGVVLGTTDGGTTWVSEHSGWTIYDLHSVFFTDALNGYAVGDHGTILKTAAGPVGFKEINASTETFGIFPNPAKDEVNIHSSMDKGDMSIYDVTGRQLKYTPFYSGSFIVDISDLTTGIYFVKLINDHTSVTQKLIVR